MLKITHIFLITLLSINLFSQEIRNQFDSVGEKHGLWEIERELYCKNDDCSIIIYGVEKGIYSHGKKVDFWTILDDKRKLFKQEFYQNDTLLLTINYKRNRILSIAIVEGFNHSDNKNISVVHKALDVTNFNKGGKAKKRVYKSTTGETITEKY